MNNSNSIKSYKDIDETERYSLNIGLPLSLNDIHVNLH